MTTAETMETQATPATNPESEVAQESSASTPVAAPEKSFDEMSDMEALEFRSATCPPISTSRAMFLP